MELLKKSDNEASRENSEDSVKPVQNSDSEVSGDRIRELALSDSLTSALLILMHLNELKAMLSLELQAIRDDRKAQKKEFREFMGELGETLTKIQAQFRIEAQLLGLIGSQKTGDEGWENEKNSNRCRTLDGFAKNTH